MFKFIIYISIKIGTSILFVFTQLVYVEYFGCKADLVPTILTQPIDQLDCEGNSVSFRVIASGIGLNYIWQRKKPADSDFTTIPIESNIDYPLPGKITITNVGSAQSPHGTQYRVIISDGIDSIISNEATLSVNEILGITPTSTNVTRCYGANYSYTVTTRFPANVVSYQWKRSVESGVWNNVVDGVHFSGSNSATLNIINGTPNESAEYRVYITFYSSGADCNVNSSSRTRKITFLPQLLTPVVSIANPNCIQSTGSITVTIQSVSDTYSFDNGITFQSSNVKSDLASGTYSVVIKNISGCVSTNSICIITPSILSIWDGNAWFPNPPTSNDAVDFNGDYTSDTNMQGDVLSCCSCLINPGAIVTISPGDTLKITNGVTVAGGSLIFEDDSNLLQLSDSAINVGNIVYKRTTNPVRKYDYTYWSSPVQGCTLGELSPNTPGDKYFSFDPIADDWKSESSGTIMTAGKGYIIRAPQNFDDLIPSTFASIFNGVPNNGSISYGGIIAGKLYLLGNPYPSALDADKFLQANTMLEGTIYFWTHNTPITNNVYTSDDYASYNGVGGVSTLPAESGGVIPTGKIAAGQSFFTTGASSGSVIFTNDMRVDDIGNPLDNSQFFKYNLVEKVSDTNEKHRIWLSLSNEQGVFKQILLGYVKGASNDYDSKFDGTSLNGNEFVDFYSIIENKNLSIQGRSLPFQNDDIISLGYKTTIEGVFSISIDNVDGLLKNKNVFLEDKLTNRVHNLRYDNYEFTSLKGDFDNRFVLKYTNDQLSTPNEELLLNNVSVTSKHNEIIVKSSQETIQNIVVYDLFGRQLFKEDSINDTEFLISMKTEVATGFNHKVSNGKWKGIYKKVDFLKAHSEVSVYL